MTKVEYLKFTNQDHADIVHRFHNNMVTKDDVSKLLTYCDILEDYLDELEIQGDLFAWREKLGLED